MNNSTDTNNQWSNLNNMFGGSSNPTEDEINWIDEQDKYPNPIASQYNSLYEELLAKCDISNFRNNPEMAKIANDLYARIMHHSGNSKEIRNEAIEKLGIKFSTEKLYNSLMDYFNPEQYTNPYDKDLIDSAIDFEEKTKQNADDIRQLEQIEEEAKPLKS